jgi:uncharacterized protein YprB with RNaseH-like and TPR domain
MKDKPLSFKQQLAYLARRALEESADSSEGSLDRSRGEASGEAPPTSLPEEWQRVSEYVYVREFAAPLRRLNLADCRALPIGDGERLLFFDTETTGLSGGAGTIVFLVGLAWQEKDRLRVEQTFLSDFPGEQEFLSRLAGRLTSDRVFVSYNGKCFDTHILKNRFLMNGLRLDLPNQLDLLFLARRLWKRIVGQCTLAAIEDHVLGIRRTGDLPGWQVPEVYFSFLRTGRSESLAPVFDHNCQDVLSLVALLDLIAKVMSEDRVSVPVDLTALGEFLLTRQEVERGVRHLEESFRRGDSKAGRILGGFHKKNRNWRRAVEIWQKLSEMGDPTALLELAKYYEHRERDPRRALDWVDSFPSDIRDLPLGSARRRARLVRKLARPGPDGRS